MANYKIEAYEGSKTWDSKYGQMVDHIITVRDEADTIHTALILTQKPDTPAPAVGQQITGTLQPGQWGTKFKKEQQEHANKVGGGGGGTWKPRDPSEIAAIQRQHSQEMAIRFAAISPQVGKALLDAGKASASLEAILKPLIDWFQRDVNSGIALAKADGQTVQAYGQRKDTELTGQSDVPFPSPDDFQHPQASLEGTPFAVGS